MKTKRLFTISFGLVAAGVMQARAQTQQTTGGNLWGYAFGDYAYVAHGDSAARGNGVVQYKGLGAAGSTQGQNAVEIRRAYLGYDYVINKKFSASALLAYEGNQDANGNRTLYLKCFNFTWKNIFPKSNLIVGEMLTPSYITTNEPEWGYRSIERTLMDMRKVDAPTDMGIELVGTIASFKCADTSKAPTTLGYQVMMGDNTGNSPVPGFTSALSTTPLNSTTDKLKKWRANLYCNTLNNAVTIGVYADYLNQQGTPYPLNVYTLKGYVYYTSKWFSIGAEYFMQSGKNYEVAKDISAAAYDTTSSTQSGWSVYAHGDILQGKLGYFARVDMYNPDVNYKNSRTYKASIVKVNYYTETFITAGLDWTPTSDKKVHIMPNIWYDGIHSENYTSLNNKYDYYLVPRLTFYYIFKK